MVLNETMVLISNPSVNADKYIFGEWRAVTKLSTYELVLDVHYKK